MKVLDAYPWIADGRFCGVREEQSGAYASCDCPLRNHSHSRLRFWLGRDNQLMFGCYACGPHLKGEILRAAGVRWSNCFPEGTPIDYVHQECTARYYYRDEHGKALYLTKRMEPGRHGRDKDFQQWKINPAFDASRPSGPDNRKWVKLGNVRDLPRAVLYRLPQLIRAHRERPVFIVGGEKDADTLTVLGLVATTNVCGESAEWLQSYSDTLAGRHVVIVEDADDAGRRHANEVLGSVMRQARSVSVVRLPQKDATAFVLAKARELQGRDLFGGLLDDDELDRAVREEFERECRAAKCYGWQPEAWRVM